MQIFFPQNSSKQGIITDFVTAQLRKGTFKRSREALTKIIYDDDISDEVANQFGLTQEGSKELLELIRQRRQAGRSKIVSFNPNFNQDFEAVQGNRRGTKLSDRKLHREYLQYMNNIGSNELATLFPYIRFYYRYRENDNKTWKEVAFPFPMFSKEEEFSILKDRFSRGDGAGVESLSVDRKFPAMGNVMSVKVNASFFFQNTNVLTKDRTINGRKLPYGFSFLKLVDFLDSSREQIVVEYGWGLSNFTDTSIIEPEMQDLIRVKEKKRWTLRYVGHDFNIAQDGSVRLGINFTTSQESDVYMRNDVGVLNNKAAISQQPASPAIKKQLKLYTEMRKTDEDLRKQIKELENKVRLVKKEIRYNKTDRGGLISKKKRYAGEREGLLEKRKKLSLQMNNLRKRLGPFVKSIFVDTIINNYEMFALTFHATDQKNPQDDSRTFNLDSELSMVIPDRKKNVRNFKKLTNFSTEFDTGKFDSIFLNRLGDTEEERDNFLDKLVGNLFNRPKGLMEKKKNKDKKFGYILFFPLRALISAAYNMLNEEEKEKYPYVALGNVPARSLNSDYVVNLGDVLIEVETFQKWYHNNYYKKNRLQYAFGDFLQDIMRELVPQALYNSSTGIFGQNKLGVVKPMVFETTLKNNRKDRALLNDLYYNYSNTTLRKFSDKILRPGEKTKDETSGMVLYTIVRNPSSDQASPFLKLNLSKTNFDEREDSKFGVSYVKIGADSGLLRNINFSATDFSGLRTALWAEGMKDNPATRIRYKYSANVELVGNNVFFKGGYFAISPNSLGLVDATYDPGIVGYYVIQSVTDNISRGEYSTNAYGTWVYNPAMLKNRGQKALEQESNADAPPTELRHTVANYIEELLSLDPNTLDKNGITSDIRTDRQAAREGKQKDWNKDAKERFRIRRNV